MKQERSYEFRKRISQIHKKGIRDSRLGADTDEFEIPNPCTIVIEEGASDVIYTAAKDLSDFLFVSMSISSVIVNC